jgi:hypothetical protein
VARIGETKSAYRTRVKKSRENAHYEDQEGNRRITLRQILVEYVVRIEGRWNRIRIAS